MIDKFTKQRIARKNGRTIHFDGRLMCSTEFPSRDDATIVVLELWESKAGSWVAVARFERDLDDGGNKDTVQAVLIAPDDEMAMQDAAMDFWGWENLYARSMVKKQLKWNLSVTVP